MTRARETRRERNRRRSKRRTALTYLAWAVGGAVAGVGIDVWIHQ